MYLMGNEDMYGGIKRDVSNMIDEVKNMDGDNYKSVIQSVKSKLESIDTLTDSL